MSNQIKVIIGASYGDEGKGLATDFFGSRCQGGAVGVLMNGGPQRGHTVETADGLRHVFHHFSSSSFHGHPTYCAEEFIVNPMVCLEEYAVLSGMGSRPGLILNPGCRFTTPYDMWINQILLDRAGVHNSCGMGIWETIVRYAASPFHMTIREFASLSPEDRADTLRRIRDEYMPARLRQCGIDAVPPAFQDLVMDEGILFHYLDDMEAMLRIASILPAACLHRYPNVLFENGQGLLLDGNNPATYEDSTPSTTGVGRIHRTIEQVFDGAQVEVCYVSRSYLTRHGDGLLPGECRREDLNPSIFDRTNEPNPFQGALRYARLSSAGALAERIARDFSRCRSFTNRYHCSLMVTHQNEVTLDLSGLHESFARIYSSDGRTAESVVPVRQ